MIPEVIVPCQRARGRRPEAVGQPKYAMDHDATLDCLPVGLDALGEHLYLVS